MYKELDDIGLQECLRADDRSALAYIYEAHKDEFVNFSKRYELRIEDSLDIYQDAIIAMYQNFVTQQLQLQSSSIKTYLFGIGKHKIYNKLKVDKKYLQVVPKKESYEEVILEESNLTYYQDQLVKLLANMSESCKEILRLYYYRNLTVNEIVTLTNYKDANTVKSHKSRCMKTLKSMVN
ncbi:MAG: RNA polymerase sigma factor [bacterium]